MILNFICLGQGENVQINDLAPQFAKKEELAVSIYNVFKTALLGTSYDSLFPRILKLKR